MTASNPAPMHAGRVTSVDVFRGLIMLVMIFVNDLAGVRGLPAWTYHMAAQVDAMTYVDMVFPAFLFAMGLSLPLALERRMARDPSVGRLWLHIAVRSASLLILGLVLANADKADTLLMPVHLTRNAWALLALCGAAMSLLVYPGSRTGLAAWVIKSTGLLLLAAMLLIFRRSGGQGHALWLDFSYWEILGLLGWTYLATCIIYVPFRRFPAAPVIALLAMAAFHLATAAHLIRSPNHLPPYLWPWENGAMPVLMLSGIVTADFLLFRRNVRVTLLLAMLLLIAAVLAAPLGISKIRATPTWALGSAGVSLLLFLLLYWICDVRRMTRWSAFVRPAGSNTLLTYLLPDFFAFGVSLAWLPAMWSIGLPGAFRAALFTALMLLISAILTRWRIRLHL